MPSSGPIPSHSTRNRHAILIARAFLRLREGPRADVGRNHGGIRTGGHAAHRARRAARRARPAVLRGVPPLLLLLLHLLPPLLPLLLPLLLLPPPLPPPPPPVAGCRAPRVGRSKLGRCSRASALRSTWSRWSGRPNIVRHHQSSLEGSVFPCSRPSCFTSSPAHPCSTVSGGWRMRVSLGQALFSTPSILLLGTACCSPLP